MTAPKTGKHLAGFILFTMMFFLTFSCPTKKEFKQDTHLAGLCQTVTQL